MAIIYRLLSLFALCVLAACVPGAPSAPASPMATVAWRPSPTPTATEVARTFCQPTLDDGVSPSYTPDALLRATVGRGHVLTGVVRSSKDCGPIANAKLELWLEEAGKGHPDEARATLFTDQNGKYRFESNPPEHIHMRISAPGYRTIGVNSYHPTGRSEGRLDIVLAPD